MVGDTSYGTMSTEEIVKLFQTGKVVGFPTDTVYGMGCIFSEDCVQKLRELKKGREKPFAVFVPDLDSAKELVEEFPDYINTLIKKHWPGGLTLIFKARKGLPSGIVSGEGKIGIRIPDFPPLIEAMKRLGSPVINTSANLPGEVPPVSHKDVRIPLELMLKGESKGGIPSTVVDVTGERPVIIRMGAVKVFEIEAITGKTILLSEGNVLNILYVCSGNTCRSPMAQYHLSYCARELPLFIRSCGTLGFSGSPASENAIKVMEEIGVNLTVHRSTPVSRELIQWADLILPMEPVHREEVLSLGANPYTILPFYEIIDLEKIPDPIGRDIEFYREVRDLIVKGNAWLEKHLRERFNP